MRRISAALAAIAACCVPAPAAAGAAPAELPSTTPLASWWIPNGPVTSIVPAGDRVYVSGAFYNWGPSTGHGVVVDAAGARIDSARFEAQVEAAAPDGSGGWYVGGDFDVAGGAARGALARVRADGSLDGDWTPAVNPPEGKRAEIYDIVPAGDRVIVSGVFQAIEGYPAARLVAFDAQTGERDPGFAPQLASLGVTDLALDGGELLVATSTALQRLDAATGAADPSFATVTTTDRVGVIALSGDRLYLGGRFYSVNGEPRAGLALVDAQTGVLDPAWTPTESGEVVSMLAAGGRVIVSGTGSLNGVAAQRTGSLDPVTGTLDAGWCAQPDTVADVLASDGVRVYMGSRGSLCGSPERNVAALSLAGGDPDPTWAPGADDRVLAIALQGSRVFLGGDLGSVGGQRNRGVVALDTATGRPDPSFVADVPNGGPIELAGDRLYVARAYAGRAVPHLRAARRRRRANPGFRRRQRLDRRRHGDDRRPPLGRWSRRLTRQRRQRRRRAQPVDRGTRRGDAVTAVRRVRERHRGQRPARHRPRQPPHARVRPGHGGRPRAGLGGVRAAERCADRR